MDVAQRYFDAWNRRDPAAIVATFAEGGTYSDPIAAHGPMGPAIADYARGLFAAFPDLSFEIVSAALASDGMVAAQWLMHMQPGKLTKPGAFSLTVIQVRSDREVDEVRAYGRRIMGEMAQMPGFISFLAATVGHRLFTITAWEDTESPRQLLQGGAHKEAMQRFFGPDFAVGGMTSV